MFIFPGNIRRPFAVLALNLALGCSAFAADAPPPADLANPTEVVTAAQLAALPPHPRLFANAARFTQLREQLRSDADTAEIFSILRQRAELLFATPPINYQADSYNMLPAVRKAQRCILTYALLYRLTDDERYLAGTRHIIDGLLAQNWPTSHFLDIGEASFALSVAADWLHDTLTPDELTAIANKLHTNALLASANDENRQGWIWAAHNWNQVCNGGLVCAAFTFPETNPALARHIINRALLCLPRAAATYAPAGVFPEGPSYWRFGTTYHLIQLEAHRSVLGTTQGLERFPGFLQSAAYIDQVTGPTGAFFNHADNLDERDYSAASLWFARENRRPDLAHAELLRLRANGPALKDEDTRDLPLFLLWWTPLPKPLPSTTPAPLHWRGESEQPLASLRSAWDDPLATWIAIKGGTANHSHAHMDVGSFVFEARGVRWAIDPVRDDYAFIRKGGYTQAELFNYAQDSRRWKLFRLGPEGHNILRFDGAQQNINGHASVSPINESADGASVTIDLTSTYADHVATASRRATLRPDKSVMLTDTWTTLDKPVAATWQWLTRAKATIEKNGVRLEQDGQTLHLRIEKPTTAKIELQPVAPLLNPKVDTRAPDLTRILLHLATPAKTTTTLSVHLLPEEKL